VALKGRRDAHTLLATTVVEDLAGRKAHWAKKFLAQHFLLIAPLRSRERRETRRFQFF
jgi:hypothetical protein